MTDLKKAAQQALEALESLFSGQFDPERGQRCGNAVLALKAALAQQEPRNQCGETCERAKLCAVCARGLEQQKQCADESDCTHMPWCRVRKACQRAAQAKHEPLSVEALARALVASRVIDAAALDDPEGYDDGVMLERVRAAYRRLV
jgi:hypothetical protein